MLGDAGVMAMDVTVALLLTTPPPHPVQSATTASKTKKGRPAKTECLE
jgi:hypothetical protein